LALLKSQEYLSWASVQDIVFLRVQQTATPRIKITTFSMTIIDDLAIKYFCSNDQIHQNMKIALAQINPKVGALGENAQKITVYCEKACRNDAEVIVFPELSICGYPPEDLLHRAGFIERCEKKVSELAAKLDKSRYVIVGTPLREGKLLFNAAAVLHAGKVLYIYKKQILPNYSVFDEKRYFSPGSEPLIFKLNKTRLALTICEDLWDRGPAAKAKAQGAEIILNLNASPYHIDKHKLRTAEMAKRAEENSLGIVYVNQVGGQDELIFDGSSFVMNQQGKIISQAESFSECLQIIDTVDLPNLKPVVEDYSRLEQIHKALVLGIKDYVNKNHFKGVLLGLSGGIDSALTLALAVEALGPLAVQVVLMPSRFTADMSIDDSLKMAKTLGVEHTIISIEKPFTAFLDILEPALKNKKFTVTEENVQARIRGIILMALSNKTGRMLLTTGNKSEMAVGYATLYGDMAGGFAPLKDVSKTLVYELSNWINRKTEIIPARIITREPSAELAPNQADTDSLPPYEILDPILERYVEKYQCTSEIIQAGFSAEVVKRITKMVDRNEYKRRQSPPGCRITKRAYGKDRRYPITNGFVSE